MSKSVAIAIAVCCLLMNISTSVIAAPALDKVCEAAGAIAEVTMTERQKGVPYEQLMNAAKKNFTDGALEFALKTIERAYEQDIMSTREGRETTILLFKSNTERNCYKNGQ